ncbi:MAG: rRNA (adenine1518-N6/adenine1519-N6)-dimethyltransferase [Solirubrobacterales bacterium]|nr:rRNA (adenine1518-N6/adenine1519-N6)-dimethyltransferase [Solirubrobacterales bacterium]
MVRLGQNFLADANLLDAIVRDARLSGDEVVLEVGGGEGALSARLAEAVSAVHVVELDERLRAPLEAVAADHPELALHWGDAMRMDLGALDPAPTAVVANLPYAVATPLIIHTITELPSVQAWTVMVQREIADRLRAAPGSRVYGAPSVIVQLACSVELVRAIDPAVFRPRPRVHSALIRLERTGGAAGERVAAVVRGAFAHRRKALARSLDLAGVAERGAAVAALENLALDPGARAEALAPEDFRRLAEALA